MENTMMMFQFKKRIRNDVISSQIEPKMSVISNNPIGAVASMTASIFFFIGLDRAPLIEIIEPIFNLL